MGLPTQVKSNANVKVIIVGGGIAGLTLANSLQYAGIDFTMIEKGEVLDPQIGASIGILPNGARILDQIGCFADLNELTVSMETSASHKKDGTVIGPLSDALKLMERRTGYSVFFLDRQLLLRVLAKHIIDPTKILLNKSVKSIEQSDEKAVVRCTDGTSIEGDIVVGADGVYSHARREMWRHADEAGEGERFEKDKNSMTAEYKCLFGISSSIPGMTPGQTDRTYAKDMSTLSYVGKEGRIFWFVFVKMDKVYYPPNIPKFNSDDAESLMKEIGSLAIREKGVVTVNDLYRARVTCNLVAIEEAEYQHWSYGRIVCLGDSIHKMTPNLGAGASSAIESAAVLSNVIVPLASERRRPSVAAITNAFQEYQKTRALRIGRSMKFSNTLTRVQALKGTKEYIYTHHIAPRSDDSAAEMFSSFVIGASLISHLPVPLKSLQGTMPFNPKHGWGYEESKYRRARHALPLVLIALFCYACNPQNIFGIQMPEVFGAASNLSAGFGSCMRAMPTYQDVMYGIWLLESTRLNNKGTFAQLPILLALAAQQFGTGVVASLYFFFLYVQTPIETFRASDNRLTDVSYTSTAGPLLILFGVLPKCLQCWPKQLDSLADTNWMIQKQPFIMSATQFLLAHSVIPSNIRYDRLWDVRRDVPWVRATLGMLIAACVLIRIGAIASLPTASSLQDLISQLAPSSIDIGFASSGIAWLGLVFHDLLNAGMIKSLQPKLALFGIMLLALVDPGIMLATGWLWREEILLNNRHKDASTNQEPEKPGQLVQPIITDH